MCYSKFVLFFVKYFQLSEMFYGGNNGRDMRRFLKKRKAVVIFDLFWILIGGMLK